MKQQSTPMVPSPNTRSSDDAQLRRDRRTAFIVVVVMAALMALLVWLASFGGGVPYDGIDYWQMMP